jgi:hypothetical protein
MEQSKPQYINKRAILFSMMLAEASFLGKAAAFCDLNAGCIIRIASQIDPQDLQSMYLTRKILNEAVRWLQQMQARPTTGRRMQEDRARTEGLCRPTPA